MISQKLWVALIIGTTLVALTGSRARAAEPPPPAVTTVSAQQQQELMMLWRRQRDEQSQARQDVQATLSVVAAELAQARGDLARSTKREADLDAYLKACGDRPGCTVPITK